MTLLSNKTSAMLSLTTLPFWQPLPPGLNAKVAVHCLQLGVTVLALQWQSLFCQMWTNVWFCLSIDKTNMHLFCQKRLFFHSFFQLSHFQWQFLSMHGSGHVDAASDKKLLKCQSIFYNLLLLMMLKKNFFLPEIWHTSCPCPNEQGHALKLSKKFIFQKVGFHDPPPTTWNVRTACECPSCGNDECLVDLLWVLDRWHQWFSLCQHCSWSLGLHGFDSVHQIQSHNVN